MLLLRVRNTTCATIAALALVALLCAPVALAVFTTTAHGGPLTVGTATLGAPQQPAASQVKCRTGKNPEIEVTWSATESSYATGYTVERASSSNGPYTSVSSVSINKTTYVDSAVSLTYSSTYYYRVSAVYRSWSTASSVASVKTLTKNCLAS
jgi:hypothetical protein